MSTKVYDKKTGFPMYGVPDMWKVFVGEYLKANPTAWVKNHDSIFKLVYGKPTLIIDYITYSAVLKRGNELYKNKILDGYRVTLLNNLGEMFAAILDVNSKRFIPDWPHYKKTGELTVRQNDTYPAIIWRKFCRVKNEKVYEFVPARGRTRDTKGFVQMLYRRLDEDPMLATRYVRIKNIKDKNGRIQKSAR